MTYSLYLLHLTQMLLHEAQIFERGGLFSISCLSNFKSMKRLHKILKKKREIKGYSQEYIAGIMKVSISTISRWESGEIIMTVDQIEDYAHALEMETYELLAAYANQDRKRLVPLVKLEIEVFNKGAYYKIMDIIKELDPLDIIIHTKPF